MATARFGGSACTITHDFDFIFKVLVARQSSAYFSSQFVRSKCHLIDLCRKVLRLRFFFWPKMKPQKMFRPFCGCPFDACTSSLIMWTVRVADKYFCDNISAPLSFGVSPFACFFSVIFGLFSERPHLVVSGMGCPFAMSNCAFTMCYQTCKTFNPWESGADDED